MDDNLKNCLDQLNEEQTSDLLEKNINFDIDKKAIARVKASVFKKVRKNKRTSVFSKKFIACAAAVILVFCTMSAVGFNNIAAAMQQVIKYIPGFGIAPENNSRVPQDPSRDILEVKVMKKPLSIEVQGEKAEINSCYLNIYKDQVIVTVILRYPPNINLNGELFIEYSGEKIYRDSEMDDFSSPDDGKKYKEMYYNYTIRNPKEPINTLTFNCGDRKVEIAFEKSEDLNDKVISQNFDGIIVSAVPLNQNRSKFILTSTYEKNLYGVMFISSLAGGIDNIKAIDEAGNEYEIKKSTSQGSEYYVNGDIKGKIVSLKFNKLYQGFTYEENKSLMG